jgi:type IV secretion system protein VirB9
MTLSLFAFVAVGCQASATPDVVVEPDERLVPAQLDAEGSDLPTTQPIVEVVPVAAPQLRSFDPAAADPKPPEDGRTAIRAMVDAKASHTKLPAIGDFINANQVYDYAGGLVFTAVCSPGFVTTIALEPGESITAVTAGDTTRWQLETVEGAGADGTDGSGVARTFILLKPGKPDCDTNLVIITDRRVYQLDLKSVSQPVYHTQISWNYPGLRIGMGRGGGGGGGGGGIGRADRAEAIGKFDIDKLNFGYLIKKQKGKSANAAPPAWCPLRAFDDGAKTYIQFPPGRLTSEAPPLFVLSASGEAQVVNYRVKGDYYVVDRLFDRAELRLGEHPQQLVRIERAAVKDER